LLAERIHQLEQAAAVRQNNKYNNEAATSKAASIEVESTHGSNIEVPHDVEDEYDDDRSVIPETQV
jgi:hypothetical protein